MKDSCKYTELKLNPTKKSKTTIQDKISTMKTVKFKRISVKTINKRRT